ncbi:hypothetical protein CLU96_1950 [Chryseobacterium sp. 52]|nr:hypothetical protein CLU96_1950 [Chryseobacterium sp. 52]
MFDKEPAKYKKWTLRQKNKELNSLRMVNFAA